MKIRTQSLECMIIILLPVIGSHTIAQGRQALHNDSNRLTKAVESGHDGIILITPNIDDDNGDGKSDADDEIINGLTDSDDLTFIEVPIPISQCSPTIEGLGANFYNILEQRRCSDQRTQILIEATTPRSSRSAAMLKFDLETEQYLTYHLDIKPFVLTSSVDPTSEVFIVDVPGSKQVIKDLKSILAKMSDAPKLTVLYNKNGDVNDVWIQDATEIGFFEDTSIFAALTGLRAKFAYPQYFNPEILDRYFAEVFCGPGRCVLSIGVPLAKRRWIDWFGNLESTPPFVDQNGKEFPWGRILTSRQRELSMQDPVMDFLRDQKVQWPPIVMDTSFLMIGHVDEIVNFIPAKSGFKAILASPILGRELLERLSDDGYGDKILLKGKTKKEITVDMTLSNAKLMAANDSASKIMVNNRNKLMRELNLVETDLIELPIFIKPNGLVLWPNPVNGLVLGDFYIAPKPFGPILEGRDYIEEFCREAFAKTKTVVHFLDVYDRYSMGAGEIHCGTNAIRNRARHRLSD